MSDQQVVEFKLSLLEFVKRASKEGATTAEVEALPAVAQVLMDAEGIRPF